MLFGYSGHLGPPLSGHYIRMATINVATISRVHCSSMTNIHIFFNCLLLNSFYTVLPLSQLHRDREWVMGLYTFVQNSREYTIIRNIYIVFDIAFGRYRYRNRRVRCLFQSLHRVSFFLKTYLSFSCCMSTGRESQSLSPL